MKTDNLNPNQGHEPMTICQGGLAMATRTLISGLVLLLLLGVQAIFLPGAARALNCCPCSKPCGGACVCRGSSQHCPSCRDGGDSFFQAHVKTIISASDFSLSYEPLFITLPAANLSYGIVAHVKEGYRRIGNLTSRLLPSPEFRIKAWCPGTLDKSI